MVDPHEVGPPLHTLFQSFALFFFQITGYQNPSLFVPDLINFQPFCFNSLRLRNFHAYTST